MTEKKMVLKINNTEFEVDSQYLDWTLLRYLREVLHLTGTKQGCDNEGTCGTCTVIIDGKSKRSCLTKMSKLDGANVETIENLQITDLDIPHPLVQTVIQDGIFQCGYCAPGAMASAKALLDKNLNPSSKEIERVLSTVICRCVGLNRMDLSVQRAAEILRGEKESTWTPEDTANEQRTIARVTGRQMYTDDLSFPNMLYARALRANVPHARVRSLDVSKAEKMPGIVRVFTAKDVPGENIFGVISADQQVFCDEKIRYVGDTLALVVGESPDQAAAALEEIEFEFDMLPVVSEPEDAMAPDAPIIHERLSEQNPETPNVLNHFKVRKGDIQIGFDMADVIVQGDYQVPFVEHAYMETEAGIAVPHEDGSLTIYCGTQGPEEDLPQIERALGLEKGQVRITHMYMGGGFGGKEDINAQIHVGIAAQAIGRPVKSRWSRTESLMVSYKRHKERMHYKMGATKDGEIVAAEVSIIGDTGAYTSAGEAVIFRSNSFACGPYNVPHAKVDSFCVYTNNPPCGAFRGYGSPQVAFSSEVHMQKICDELGLDPFDFRLKNALGIGGVTITGDVLTKNVGAGVIECLKAVRTALEKTQQPVLNPGEKLGIGIATAMKNVGLGSNIPDASGAKVSLEPDGIFLVRHGATDMGQGVNDVVAIIVARVMGVQNSMVQVHTADTLLDPPGGMTTASRATFLTGNATVQASEQLREQLWTAVSGEFSISVEDLEISGNMFVDKQTSRTLISLKDLAQGSGGFEAEVRYDAPKTQPPAPTVSSYPETPQAPMHFAYDFGAQAAMVAVDEETGKVRVLKIIAAHDVGLPISQRNVIGQIEGGVIQGLGYALTEEYRVENGIPQSTKLKDLGLHRFRDLPEIEPIIVEDPHPLGPFNAKGMGELVLAPVAPAIANAIHDAIGVWVNELPMTPEKVLKAIEAKHADE
jgi:aldehyde oxidoreductase